MEDLGGTGRRHSESVSIQQSQLGVASDNRGLLTFECRLALLNLFFASLGEAGFVRGFSQIVEFAFVQPHGSVTKCTRDGGEAFFHVAHGDDSTIAVRRNRRRCPRAIFHA